MNKVHSNDKENVCSKLRSSLCQGGVLYIYILLLYREHTLIILKSSLLVPDIKQMIKFYSIDVEECLFQYCELHSPWVRGSGVRTGL